MKKIRARFIEWYFDEFRYSDLYIKMIDMTEDSPYHREGNVANHTNMVVAHYLSATNYDNNNFLIGVLACAFHDTGKPDAVVYKNSEARGDYKAFPGHELASARKWEDYAVSNWSVFDDFGLSVYDIYTIGWMIENHLPWAIKKTDKRTNMILTIKELGIDPMFFELLSADTHGRISDDGPEKRQKVRDWIADFKSLMPHHDRLVTSSDDMPILYLPIGVSGTGKSTFRKTVDAEVHSLDDLRTEFYGDDYAEAFRLSTEDKTFNNRANARYMELIKSDKNVFVDNTNLSKKRRRGLIVEAQKRGYHIRADLFPVSLQTVIDRQDTRTDKSVPKEAVIRQYRSIQLPSFGEVHQVVVHDTNIAT